ncbi:putative membrane protein [Spinactinospora alkalitolerans]|uniref:Putative membrane protein n=1 Tax=Spinactinospora alkalitolerans TaxID=687207 RepID=A0A852TXG8_9ACTN|nr:hypothetical protein [Spinactinospora alkalitolerans]NYE49196.1 putative membrane protein [Spinactinospora alkalitolerans]
MKSLLSAIAVTVGVVVLGYGISGLGTVTLIRHGGDFVLHEDFPFWIDVVTFALAGLFSLLAAGLAARLMLRGGWRRRAAVIVPVAATTAVNVVLNLPFLVDYDEPVISLRLLGISLVAAVVGAVVGARPR